jgi:hypothetical protein
MKYKFLNYVISIENNLITVLEYIFIENENIFRSFLSPAEIDSQKDALIIHKDIIKGKDIDLSPEELFNIFYQLPQWNQSAFCIISDKNHFSKYFSESLIKVINQR